MKEIFRKIASALLFAGSTTLTVVLTVLCLAWFRSGFLHAYAPVIASIGVTVEVIYILAALMFWMKGSQIVYKSMLTGLILAAILLTGGRLKRGVPTSGRSAASSALSVIPSKRR